MIDAGQGVWIECAPCAAHTAAYGNLLDAIKEWNKEQVLRTLTRQAQEWKLGYE